MATKKKSLPKARAKELKQYSNKMPPTRFTVAEHREIIRNILRESNSLRGRGGLVNKLTKKQARELIKEHLQDGNNVDSPQMIILENFITNLKITRKEGDIVKESMEEYNRAIAIAEELREVYQSLLNKNGGVDILNLSYLRDTALYYISYIYQTEDEEFTLEEIIDQLRVDLNFTKTKLEDTQQKTIIGDLLSLWNKENTLK